MQRPTSTVLRRTFRKAERLTSRKALEDLVRSGKSCIVPSFRLVWKVCELDTPFPAQIAFSVPKRNFKRAVDRNILKRRMREAYRKNKHVLYTLLDGAAKPHALLLIFTGRKILSSVEIEEKIILVIERLADAFQKNSR